MKASHKTYEAINREKLIYKDSLEKILDIGYKYGGQGKSLKGCKDIIDEIVFIADNALNKRKSIMYFGKKKDDKHIYNLFNEVIGDYEIDENGIYKINYWHKNRPDY